MANALYDKGREAFLAGGINWSGDSIKAVLVDTGAYTVNLATHQFLSDIPAGARIATSANLGSKTVAAGVADAGGAAVEHLLRQGLADQGQGEIVPGRAGYGVAADDAAADADDERDQQSGADGDGEPRGGAAGRLFRLQAIRFSHALLLRLRVH